MNNSIIGSTDTDMDRILLHTLEESSADGILVIDRHGNIAFANQHLRVMWSIPPLEILSDTIGHIIDLVVDKFLDSESSIDTMRRHFALGTDTLSDAIVFADGRTFALRSLPMFNEAGGCCGRVLYIADDTENIKKEEQIVSLNEQFRAILDASPTMIFYKDTENRFIRVNEALARANGKSKKEIEGKTCWDIYSKEAADKYWQDDMDVIASGKPALNIVEEMETPDGTKWLQTDKMLYRDIEGKIIGIVGFSVDITERTKMEQNIITAKMLLQRIIDLLPIRIFWKDNDLRYLGCNEVFAKDAGYNKPEDLIGKDDFQMAWHDQAQLYREDDFSVIKSGKGKLNFEEPQTTPNKDIIWLKTSKLLLTDQEGNTIGVLGSYENITERKKSEEMIKAKFEEIEKMNKFMIDRELKMVELKEEVKKLKQHSGLV